MDTVAPPSSLAAKVGRFAVSGGTSAVFNLALLHVLVAWCALRGGWREDLANLIALELSVVFQFTLCRLWVWKATERQGGMWAQFLRFHGAVLVTSGARLFLFSGLRQVGVHYLLNAAIGIGLAAIANYFLYDRFVFRSRLPR
ncbi:MAG TPA: GtrA family protein [Pantanalinema sp.]